MQLDPSRTIDRRRPLEKATRKELEKFAKYKGVTEIVPGMPAPLMRQILELRGCTDIHTFLPQIKHRHLGQMNGTNSAAEQNRASKEQISAIEALTRDWKAQQGQAVTQQNEVLLHVDHKPFAKMKMHELRTFCKKQGIEVSRSDKKADLVKRLEANGQNTS